MKNINITNLFSLMVLQMHDIVLIGSEMCAHEAGAAKWAAEKLSCNCSALLIVVSF